MTHLINETSNEWLTVKEYLEARLKALRESNDKPMNSEKTAYLRGQIEEVKKLLKLPEGKSSPAAKKVDYGYG